MYIMLYDNMMSIQAESVVFVMLSVHLTEAFIPYSVNVF